MNKKINKICLQDVNYKYKDVKVYKKDLNMCLLCGNIYLIKGKNGSGKSTLAGIVLKIWNDYSGEILLNDVNIKKYSREEVVNEIGICFQKTPIFHDSIRENITLGEKADAEKYISAMAFDREITDMGRTLDSELIDAGSVSGGQAQKIGIIRAVCRVRSVYIFDEPTANLDINSKKFFYELLSNIKKDCIVILISHDTDAENYCDECIQI